MARFILLPDNRRLNIDQIVTYEGGGDHTDVLLSTGEKTTIHMAIEGFHKLVSEAQRKDAFPDIEKTTIERLMRHMDDLKNAIGRMPTSIRMHY